MFKKISRIKSSRLALAIITVAIVGSGFVVSAYTFHLFGLGAKDCSAHPTKAPNSAYFTVVMTQQGYNGSQIHSSPWPIMNVTINEIVTIHVVNEDPTQSHGFAVIHYFSKGVALQSGDCVDVNFPATLLGTFRVFCTIPCTVHIFMQDGQININP